ncbi:MAG: hypothetical protein QG639_173, partial [Patescibacteria group bacterium]|nr:hypothetical protein [Patescibacteria group bacterium]
SSDLKATMVSKETGWSLIYSFLAEEV